MQSEKDSATKGIGVFDAHKTEINVVKKITKIIIDAASKQGDYYNLIKNGNFFNTYTDAQINQVFIKDFLDACSILPEQYNTKLFNVMNIVKAIALMKIDPQIDLKKECNEIFAKLRSIQCDYTNFLWLFLGCQIIAKLDYNQKSIIHLYEKLSTFIHGDDRTENDLDLINIFKILHQVAIIDEDNCEANEALYRELIDILPQNNGAAKEKICNNSLICIILRPELQQNEFIIDHLESVLKNNSDFDLLKKTIDILKNSEINKSNFIYLT